MHIVWWVLHCVGHTKRKATGSRVTSWSHQTESAYNGCAEYGSQWYGKRRRQKSKELVKKQLTFAYSGRQSNEAHSQSGHIRLQCTLETDFFSSYSFFANKFGLQLNGSFWNAKGCFQWESAFKVFFCVNGASTISSFFSSGQFYQFKPCCRRNLFTFSQCDKVISTILVAREDRCLSCVTRCV